MPESEKGFKMTELGPLLEDWEVVRLGDVLEQAIRPEILEEEKEYHILGVRWYAVGPFEKAHTKGKNIKAKKLYRVEANDFIYNRLFAWKGSFGVIPPEMSGSYVSGEFPVFESDEKKLDVYFLWRYFSQPWIWKMIESQSTGSTKVSRLRYKQEQFLNLKIPLPPLPEQKRIAFVLSSIQEDIERTEKVIEAARELKRSMMKHLFTYGPVPVGERDKVKLKDTKIGRIPEEWEVVKVSDVFEKTRKPRSLRISPDDKVPFIPMDAISENKITVSGWKMKKIREISSGTFVFKNDLLIAKITPSFENGKQAILNNIPTNFAYATTEVWPLHPKDTTQVITEHLYNYIKIDEIRTSLADKMEGTTGRKRLPKSAIENLIIPLPPLSVQKRIAEILSAIDEKIEAEERKKKALEEVFRSMLHNLMTGKIRVKDLDLRKYGVEDGAGDVLSEDDGEKEAVE